ncbi:cyclin-dependent protein kinase inhibitor SMR2-like [Macadamia integrifolia]|uniref:cyclin-dependent protein kinase inhibitor SMR2-like n=1 Tax=Macadamia integrifolia TaxID=60698 RepID=UPI001C4F1C0B|nr:cyclin-dependent protein kinase inhibitor SMR2-like [Macadamia integrifolia]
MSTDLELQHSLPEIRLRPISTAAAAAAAAVEEVETQQPSPNEAIENSVNHRDGRGGDVIEEEKEEEEECRTPTSEDHKIPVMRSCPPAPKKQRKVASCKRKLSDELYFFEIVGRDEVESFFRSSSSFNIKKRCCSNSKSKSRKNSKSE